MSGLLERIRADGVLVADGAMGTLLIARGLPAGAPPESVNLERPEVLEEIAGLYLDAGADIVQTNTFGGSPLKLAAYGLADRAEDVNRAAVTAARRAVAAARAHAGGRRAAWVAGSCGPTGRLLEPYGDTRPDEMSESFTRQLRALVEAGVDAISVETMTDLTEAVLAVRAAKLVAPRIPVFAAMTFDATPRGFFTIMGVDVARAAAGLAAAGADVVGSNCGNGIETMVAIARAFATLGARPLIVQANAGLPRLEGDAAIYPETPEFMASHAAALIAAGARVIGGCCGTTPEHIRALRHAVDRGATDAARA